MDEIRQKAEADRSNVKKPKMQATFLAVSMEDRDRMLSKS